MKKALISFTGYDDETFDCELRYNTQLTSDEHVPMVAAYLSSALEQFSNCVAENSKSKSKLQIAQAILDLIQSDLDEATE